MALLHTRDLPSLFQTPSPIESLLIASRNRRFISWLNVYKFKFHALAQKSSPYIVTSHIHVNTLVQSPPACPFPISRAYLVCLFCIRTALILTIPMVYWLMGVQGGDRKSLDPRTLNVTFGPGRPHEKVRIHSLFNLELIRCLTVSNISSRAVNRWGWDTQRQYGHFSPWVIAFPSIRFAGALITSCASTLPMFHAHGPHTKWRQRNLVAEQWEYATESDLNWLTYEVMKHIHSRSCKLLSQSQPFQAS